MAQYQVTVEDHLLSSLFRRHDGLGQLVEQVLNQILQAQAAQALQAQPHERTPWRQGYVTDTNILLHGIQPAHPMHSPAVQAVSGVQVHDAYLAVDVRIL